MTSFLLLSLGDGEKITAGQPVWVRLLVIAGVALAAHVVVRLLSWYSRSVIRRRFSDSDKARTLIQFAVSMLVVVIYFVAAGFGLSELGVPLGTYVASATVIGLAVSFGSQLLIQDVISGLTLIFADLIDVGDMVDIGGQVGIVEHIGVRYTRLSNFAGAAVVVPNRNVANVVRYPDGFTRAFLDIHIPVAEDKAYIDAIRAVCESAAAQFPGAVLLPPDLARSDPAAGGTEADIIRAKFRIWPGQATLINGAVRSAVLAALKQLDPNYPDWQVTLVERSEMTELGETLPAPSEVLRRRKRQQAGNGPDARAE